MTKFNRRAAARPEELLDAAEQRFLAEGFSRAKVEQIAQDAGVTVGTVYRYFPSKEALFTAVVARHGDSSWSRGKEIADAYGSLTARAIVALLLERWSERLRQGGEGRVLLLLVREATLFPEAVRSWVAETIQRGCLAVERALRHGIDRGEFPLLDVEATARALVSTVVNRHVWDVTFRPDLPPLGKRSDPTRIAIELAVRGIPRAVAANAVEEEETVEPSPELAQTMEHPVASERSTDLDGNGRLRIVTLKPRTR